MSPRKTLQGIAGLGSLLLLSMSAAGGCTSCPDLAYRAFQIDLFGADRSHVLMTVTEQTTGASPCADRALSESCNADAGIYDVSFELSGVVLGEVQGVCTLGEQTGCAAEDAEAQGPWPIISVARDSTTGEWSVTLERQGACPAR